MNAQWYRQKAIENLVLAKLFGIAALVGRYYTMPAGTFTMWNELLVIVFSFGTSACWMVAGWKNGNNS